MRGSLDNFMKKRETSKIEVIQEAIDQDPASAPDPSQTLEKGEEDAEVTRKAEVLNSLIMNITAKANDTKDILQTFR